MAEEHAQTSNADGNTMKRKIVSTSESDSDSVWSVDSAFSSPAKRYKLPTMPVCVFDGKSLSVNKMTRSNCTVRGPSTSSWGPTQINQLNFQKPVPVAVAPMEKRILNFLFEPSTGPGARVLHGPEIVTTAMKEKLMITCTGNPVIEYIREVFTDLRKKGVSLDSQALLNGSKEQIAQIETYMDNKITEDQESSNFHRQSLLKSIRKCLRYALSLCYVDKKPERDLDEMIVLVMQLAQHQDEHKNDYFRIRETGQTEVKFEICGSLVTSMANILWEAGYRGKMLTTCFPIMMCENIEGENPSKQAAKKRSSVHKNLPQVIGQCISMADKSIFETKDYKIVYHVSLMSTNKLVITRTHVAKSTLKVIKDGCPIPDQNDLDPSYVFEAPILIYNDVEDLIVSLYTSLQIFEKLGYMLVCEKPGAEKCSREIKV